MIEYKNIHKAFDLPVLSGVSMRVESGEMFALFGPSGTGKSVLLKTTIGLVIPDKGDVEVDGLSQVEVADLLERHKSWVCRRLALFRRLSAELVEEAELGELPAGSLCRLAELPERNQEELWAAARSHGVAGRDVGLLADLWRRAPEPAARAWLLAHPEQAVLSARFKEEQRTIDARLGAAGEEVRRALEVLCRVSSTLASRVRRGLGELAPEGVLELQDAWERARDRSQSALELLRGAMEGRND